MKKFMAVFILSVMLLPQICAADTQMSESGSQMAATARQMLTVLVQDYGDGVEFTEEKANQLYEYLVMFYYGEMLYLLEGDFHLWFPKQLTGNFAVVISICCDKYKDYVDGKITRKEYVDEMIVLAQIAVP